MLTVKNVTSELIEDIVESTRVNTGIEHNIPPTGREYDCLVVYAHQANSDPIVFHDGAVYVMNSYGKTIGDYYPHRIE